jgi:hypothetical protein
MDERAERGSAVNEGASRQDAEDVGVGDPDAPPLAADRPYVDGSAVSSEELRAEVERLSQEDRQHVDDLREEVGDSLAAHASRFDVKARMAGRKDDVKARVTERKDEAVASVSERVDRARTAVAGGAAAASDTARRRPAVLAGAAAAVVALLVVLVRRRRA